METDFMDRMPTGDDTAGICMIDLEDNNRLIHLAETKAFCWQQASMLQWTYDKSGEEIIFNDRDGDHYVSRIINVKTGDVRTIDYPVYCLSPDGVYAISVNFSRLNDERPGYGYAGVPDKYKGVDHPDKDGIWRVNLKENSAELIISLDRLVKEHYLPSMDNVPNWVNHLLVNPTGERFAFLHRWRQKDGRHLTRMFTANMDGSEIYPLNMDDMSSHYTWTSPTEIINYSNRNGIGNRYFFYTDKTQNVSIIGDGQFDGDGHCSYSSNGKWMLTDTYPQDEHRTLILYNLEKKIRYDIGRFYSTYPHAKLDGPMRCDLHPNWSRDDKSICFDSIHEGERQVYTIDLKEFLSEEE
jgi:hypothetical protein